MPPYDPAGTGAYVPVTRVKPITADFVGDATKGGSNQLQTFLDTRRSFKAPCRVATAAALPAYARATNVITASANGSLNTAGIDGITSLVVGDRVLLKNGAAAADNGIYTVTTLGSATVKFVLTRATDADSSVEMVTGLTTMVTEGTANGGQAFYLATTGAITLNTTGLTFSKVLAPPAGAVDATTLAGAAPATAGTASTIAQRDSNGRLTVGADPTSALQVATKQYVDGKTVSGLSSMVTLTSIASAYTMAAGTVYLVKLTAAPAANLVLPAGASAGQQIVVKDGSANFQTYPVTVVPSGADTVENDTSMVLDVSRMAVTIMSDGAGGWWIV